MAVARPTAGAALILLAACHASPEPAKGGGGDRGIARQAPAPASVPAPSAATGSATADRRPGAVARFQPGSAEAAAQVVHNYFDLIRAHRYADARRLWTGGGEGSGKSEAEFVAAYAGS